MGSWKTKLLIKKHAAATSLPAPSPSSLDPREEEDEEETAPRLLCEEGWVIFLRYWRTLSYLFLAEVGA